jgi:hypothetical protein
MENSMEAPQNSKIELPYDPTILLEVYSKECKSGYNRDICTPMFIAELFTVAKLWIQFSCPTTGERILKCEIYISI